MIRRRALLGGILGCGALAAFPRPGARAASSFHLLIGAPAGSGGDKIARDFAQCLGQHLDSAEIDLVNRPGNAQDWNGPYAKDTDLKDPFGHPYTYKAPGEHGDFDLIFLGKDGAPGGDGLNKDYGNWQ